MPRPLPRLTARPGFWLALFAAYFAAQAALRVLLGDRLNIDEAEALLWAQSLDWGYGPQPPLYIWAQAAVFALTGPGVLGACGAEGAGALGDRGLRLCAGAALGRARAGGAGGACRARADLAARTELESQRIRTHNTLAALIALAAVLALLRLRADPRGRRFVALGLLFGLGLLAKWNFATLIPALLGALILTPGGARVLGRPAALWLIVLPAALIAPTGLWMAQHPEIAFASMGKLGLVAEGPAWVLWLTAFARNFAEFAGLPALVLGGFALAGRGAAGLGPEARVEMRIVLTVVAIALALVLIGGLASGATRMTSRWFLPLMLPALPVAGLWVAARLGVRGRGAFAGLSAALAAVLLIAIGAMLTRDPPLPGVPLAEMAAALPETGTDAVILAPVALAGNLALLAPDRRVTDAALLLAGPCPARLLILSADAPPHPGLAPFLERCGLAPEARRSPCCPRAPSRSPGSAARRVPATPLKTM